MKGMVRAMARRRGFFAELQYQAQQAEKRQHQQHAAAVRQVATAQREAERLHRESVRLNAALERASAAELVRLQREAAEAHLQAQLAEVESRNTAIAHVYNEIDNLLSSTLSVDDYVDLETMKVTEVLHPAFDPGMLGQAAAELLPLVYPPGPVYQEPAAPGGLTSALGGRKKHEEAVARARFAFDETQQQWHANATQMYTDYVAAMQAREKAEADRLQRLAAAEATHAEECRTRQTQADEQNASVTRLISELAYDVPSAIQEYVDIVLSNSVYPESFPVAYEHDFDLELRELIMSVEIPAPTTVPTIKEFRYVRARDEIVESSLTAKAQRDRYANATWQTAVRTFHEIFEADRNGKIHTISLTVTTRAVNPATGLDQFVPLVVAGADRETFLGFDLANVIPEATLAHLGAALSKSPFDLTAADTSRGVRARSR